MHKLQVYTDGSCKGNPGPGGWAYLVLGDGVEQKGSGGETGTTNNRMEMRAVAEAFSAISDLGLRDGLIELHSDSRLVINTMSKGWKRKQNLDVWELVDAAYGNLQEQGWQIEWHWVKGHAGHKENELVDDWAQAAADNVSGDAVEMLDLEPVQLLLGVDEDDTKLRNLLAEDIFECSNCGSKTEGKLSRKSEDGPIRVDCAKCGKYIKFGKQA